MKRKMEKLTDDLGYHALALLRGFAVVLFCTVMAGMAILGVWCLAAVGQETGWRAVLLLALSLGNLACTVAGMYGIGLA